MNETMYVYICFVSMQCVQKCIEKFTHFTRRLGVRFEVRTHSSTTTTIIIIIMPPPQLKAMHAAENVCVLTCIFCIPSPFFTGNQPATGTGTASTTSRVTTAAAEFGIECTRA